MTDTSSGEKKEKGLIITFVFLQELLKSQVIFSREKVGLGRYRNTGIFIFPNFCDFGSILGGAGESNYPDEVPHHVS